jgi:hypothetical protein
MQNISVTSLDCQLEMMVDLVVDYPVFAIDTCLSS